MEGGRWAHIIIIKKGGSVRLLQGEVMTDGGSGDGSGGGGGGGGSGGGGGGRGGAAAEMMAVAAVMAVVVAAAGDVKAEVAVAEEDAQARRGRSTP